MRRFRNPRWAIGLLLMMFAAQVLGQAPATQPAPRQVKTPPGLTELADDLDLNLNLDPAQSPISLEEQEVAELITQRLSSTEWLGALAPVALSPFFGLTCLSAIAIVGEDHLPPDHYLRRASTPLRNPLVLLTFLILTVLTSVPKFSKVSKPFAQAIDQVETYAALIILLVIRFVGNVDVGPPGTEEVAVMYSAGFVDFSAEVMLMLATIINVIVINTVKFFFEVLIWITPIPFVDAIFEMANKTLCAALATVYAFTPTIATVINLLLLAVCLLAFSWVKRREVYYRTILLDFVQGCWRPNAKLPANAKLVVFPKQDFQGIPAFSKCLLSKIEDGWQLDQPRLLRSPQSVQWSDPKPEIQTGLLMNGLNVGDSEFKFGRRYNRQLSVVASRLNLRYLETTESVPSGNLSAEFA